MQITQVCVQKYRAFDHQVKIPLSSFTVLTGPNNLGKSTVLRALDLFFAVFERGHLSRHVPSRRYKASDDYPKSYKRGRKWPTRIDVTIALSPDEKTSAEAATGLQLPNQIELSLEIATATALLPQVKLTSAQLPDEEKLGAFSEWFARNVSYVYIPATRAIDSFRQSVFSELIRAAIYSLSKSKQRVEQVERFYADVSKRMASVEAELTEELRPYLPDVKQVRLVLSNLDLLKLVDVTDVQIDDGAMTSLSQKGDGFKSVFAMSVLQYIAKQRSGKNLIFAIEEPESHLHSSAIYEVKRSLESLSKNFQTLITTHSPVLIQRELLAANVIVGQAPGTTFSSSAKPARSLAQIRESLGIRLQDNMTSAEVVVLVEGATEETCLGKVLSRVSTGTAVALGHGRVRIINAGSASKMTAVLRALARDVVNCVALADADTSGQRAKVELLASGLINSSDVFSVPVRVGYAETEFEDAFPASLWIAEVSAACGIACKEADFINAQQQSGSRGNRAQKWSGVMATLCATHGKAWNDVEGAAKSAFAAAVTAKAPTLNPNDYPWAQSLASRITTHLQTT